MIRSSHYPPMAPVTFQRPPIYQLNCRHLDFRSPSYFEQNQEKRTFFSGSHQRMKQLPGVEFHHRFSNIRRRQGACDSLLLAASPAKYFQNSLRANRMLAYPSLKWRKGIFYCRDDARDRWNCAALAYSLSPDWIERRGNLNMFYLNARHVGSR